MKTFKTCYSFTVSIYLAIRGRACNFCLARLYKEVTCDLKDKVLSNKIPSNFSSDVKEIREGNQQKEKGKGKVV